MTTFTYPENFNLDNIRSEFNHSKSVPDVDYVSFYRENFYETIKECIRSKSAWTHLQFLHDIPLQDKKIIIDEIIKIFFDPENPNIYVQFNRNSNPKNEISSYSTSMNTEEFYKNLCALYFDLSK